MMDPALKIIKFWQNLNFLATFQGCCYSWWWRTWWPRPGRAPGRSPGHCWGSWSGRWSASVPSLPPRWSEPADYPASVIHWQQVRSLSLLKQYSVFALKTRYTEQIEKIQLTVLQICGRSNLRERCWVDWFTALRFNFLTVPSFLLFWLLRVTQLDCNNYITNGKCNLALYKYIKLNKAWDFIYKEVCPELWLRRHYRLV